VPTGGSSAKRAPAAVRQQLYNPATNAWSSAGSLANARNLHTATLPPNGRLGLASATQTAAGARPVG
jgi:hypothetical protein